MTSTTSNSAAAESVADVEALRTQLAEAEAGLAQAEERAFELGLLFDPASYAPSVGCEGSGLDSSLADGWEEEVHIVGQVWFYRLSEALSTGYPIVQVLAGVEPLQAVTLVVPASERGRYSLLWNPATGDGTVAYGRAVTLSACRDHATWFTGGFITSEAYCARLDLYFQGQRDPVRVVLPFGGVDCARQSAALLRPSPGPLPDVTGMTLREAWLAIRLVGLEPGVTYDDPLYPDGVVWAQEPNDGRAYDPGTVIGLRSCRSGDDLVAIYQQLIGNGVRLSHGWIERSQDVDWHFISALVTGGSADGQIATWILPRFGGATVLAVGLPFLVPANNAATLLVPETGEGDLMFGDLIGFTPQDYGVEDWLELDGAVGSRRCVEASASDGGRP